MKISRSPIANILITILLTISQTASILAMPNAQSGSGVVSTYHLNTAIPADAGINQSLPIAPGIVLVGLKSDVLARSNIDGALIGNVLSDATFAKLGVQAIEPVFPIVQGISSASNAIKGEISLSNIYRLRLSPDANIWRVIQTLSSNPIVAYAEPDYIAHVIATPNDPLYSDQWAFTQINAPAAWDIITGTTDVAVAVLDSGLDTTHPDLTGQLWVNPGEVADNGVDDDNNGYVDDINGWNIYQNNADLTDSTGHGTEVAGVIAAATNNGAGMAGMCWNCRLMVIKVTQPGGIANYSDIAAGIAYAGQKGAKVINLSVGGSSDSITLRSAIAAASATSVIVGGAGNNNSSAPFYPAAYDDFVLAVAGTTFNDTKVNTSNYGTWVDISAPGEAITTTFSGGGYGSTSGTSMAAPFASGLAGLLRSQHPDWSPNQVRAHIIRTADNVDNLNLGYEAQLGSGRINANGAVNTTPMPMVQFVNYAANGQTNSWLKTSATVSLTITLRNDWRDASSVSATLSTTSSSVSVTKAAAAWGAIASGQAAANHADPFQVAVSAGAYGLDIPFSLNVVADGVTSTFTFTASTETQAVNVSGAISTDTVWTNDRVYIATGNVIVNAGITLVIQPGTVVKFNAGKVLLVNGTLIADGSPNSPILFTSNTTSPTPGDWGASVSCGRGGIIFASSSQPAQFDASGNYQGGSIIRYSIIEYSQGIGSGGGGPFIDHNLIWKNSSAVHHTGCGPGIPVISHNRIVSNSDTAVGVFTGQAVIRQNLIAGNGAAGLYLSGGAGSVISNTITGNTGMRCGQTNGTLCWSTGNLVLFSGNSIYANRTGYEVVMYNDSTAVVSATNNYWGTTNQTAIQSRIYDSNQDLNVGTFNFVPFHAKPDPFAPPILYQLSLDPASPVGIQTVTFDLTFSAPMDQSLNPTVSFGATQPYTTYAVLDNAQWITNTVWRATYDITSLVPRGVYTLSVSSAKGVDGMEIPIDTRFSFTVDYAGQITDQTPPPIPFVSASGKQGDASYVEAAWLAIDPDSSIIGYRYAIGSAAGATDIVNWTSTTATGISRSGLGLVTGRQYWLSVQAQNVGGLKSDSRYSAFVAGQQTSKVPVATNDSYFTTEDTPLTVSAPGVISNDSDPNSFPISAIIATSPSSGIFNFNADGSFAYVPTLNFNGSVTYTYGVNNIFESSNPALVTITVIPVNDPPAISDISTQIAIVNTPVSPVTFTVDDVDNLAANLTLMATSSNRTLVPTENIAFSGHEITRTITIMPATNQSGETTITVMVSDGQATVSDTFLLTVTQTIFKTYLPVITR